MAYLVFGFALAGLGFELGDLLHARFPNLPEPIARAIPLLLLSFLAGPLIVRVRDRFGFTRLPSGEEGLERIHRLLKGIEEKSSNTSLTLLAVPDDIWQPVVERCLKAADAVMVDITELTDWELGACSRYLRPEQLVMLISASARSDVK
jgi:hypothetical protein